MNIKKHIGLVLAIVLIPFFATSQTIINSPYSRIGIGDLEDQNYMGIRAMGGLGSSWAESYQINNLNPASLPYLRATCFETGVYAINKELKDSQNTSQQWGGRLNYMGIAFPLLNPINEVYEGIKRDWRLGMGFDLSRKTNLGYDITSVDSTAEIGLFTRNYSGQGGTYEFAWSNGFKYKNFSIGLKLGYFFGSNDYNRTITFNDKQSPFNNRYTDTYFTSGFSYNLGALYTFDFGQDKENFNQMSRLTVGLTYNHGSTFNIVGDELAYSRQSINGGVVIDTVYENFDLQGKGFLPGTLGFGVNYLIGNRWGFGADVSTASWSKYYHELKGDVKNQLRDITSVSFGGFIRPDYKSYENYLKRITYRYGLYYKQDPRTISGVEINDLGVCLGLGLPFGYQRKTSSANLSVELGQKGMGSVIEERYMRINFGFVFNDEDWFIKRKYN